MKDNRIEWGGTQQSTRAGCGDGSETTQRPTVTEATTSTLATSVMAATTTAVAAAMTMGWDGNGSDSGGGNGGNNDGNAIYHVYLHLKKWMFILNIILDQYKASLKT